MKVYVPMHRIGVKLRGCKHAGKSALLKALRGIAPDRFWNVVLQRDVSSEKADVSAIGTADVSG
ncbi:hypothetical protein GGU45_000676 [Niabella hirudinis]